MLDFRLNRKEQPDYILRVEPTTVTIEPTKEGEEPKTIETLDVYFADGRVFRNIAYNKNNIGKINDQQEKQILEGINNLPEFVSRQRTAKLMTLSGLIAGPIIGTATAVATVPRTPAGFFITLGAITLLTAAPGTYRLVRNYPIVNQLTKMKYRIDHKDELASFNQYENALEGVDEERANAFRYEQSEGRDPFRAMNLDSYDLEDLQVIVGNIEREKKYQFTYVKKPTNSQTK